MRRRLLSCFVLATLAPLPLAPCAQASPSPQHATHPSVDAAEATRLFQGGAAAFAAGNLAAAHIAFARLVKLAPGVAAAHTALGTVLLAQGELDAAAGELTEARRLNPHDVEATTNLAVAESRRGHMAESVALFRSLPAETLQGLPDNQVIAFAAALAQTGKQPAGRAEAEASLRSALAAHNSPALLDALGTIQAQGAQYEAAQGSFRQALTLSPDDAAAHAHLGALLLRTGRSTEAVDELRRATTLGDTQPATRLQLGRALSAAGQDAEALATLRGALAAQPHSLDAQYALALALEASGQAQEALPLFQQVVTARHDDPAVLTNYGLALVQTGDARAALVQYTRAASLAPATANLCEDMGAAYLQTNDIDHALEQFRLGVQLDPDNPQLHYDLGLAYKLKDDLPQAIAELERAAALDPGLPDPPYTLGVLRMQQGNSAGAVQQLKRALSLRPENGEAWALLGSVEKDAGDLDAAADALGHAVALRPDQPSPHVTLAAVLASKGDREGAAAERKRAAELSRTAMTRQRAGFALQSGRALLAKGDLPGAVVQLNEAIAAEPGSREAHLLLADALQKQGRPADARAERAKAEQISSK